MANVRGLGRVHSQVYSSCRVAPILPSFNTQPAASFMQKLIVFLCTSSPMKYIVSEEPPRLFSESARAELSIFVTPRAPLRLSIQTIRPEQYARNKCKGRITSGALMRPGTSRLLSDNSRPLPLISNH